MGISCVVPHLVCFPPHLALYITEKTIAQTYLSIPISGMTVPGAKHHQIDGKPEEDVATSQQIRRYRHNRQNNNGQKFAGLYTGPYFDPSMPSNVSVQLGDTALLICKVNQVGMKTVRAFPLLF